MFNVEKKIEDYIFNNVEKLSKILSKIITLELDLKVDEKQKTVNLEFDCVMHGHKICGKSVDVVKMVEAVERIRKK